MRGLQVGRDTRDDTPSFFARFTRAKKLKSFSFSDAKFLTRTKSVHSIAFCRFQHFTAVTAHQ